MSPHTVTGQFTFWTFDSACTIGRAFWHHKIFEGPLVDENTSIYRRIWGLLQLLCWLPCSNVMQSKYRASQVICVMVIAIGSIRLFTAKLLPILVLCYKWSNVDKAKAERRRATIVDSVYLTCRISLALSHRTLTSASGRGVHFMRDSICPSSSLYWASSLSLAMSVLL